MLNNWLVRYKMGGVVGGLERSSLCFFLYPLSVSIMSSMAPTKLLFIHVVISSDTILLVWMDHSPIISNITTAFM